MAHSVLPKAVFLMWVCFAVTHAQHYQQVLQGGFVLGDSVRGISEQSDKLRHIADFWGQGSQGSPSAETLKVFGELLQPQQYSDWMTHSESLRREYDSDGFRSRLSAQDSDNPYNVSDICLNNTMEYIESVTQRQLWALKMLDATGKIPSGLLSGHFFWSGDYDQCMGIEAVLVNSTLPQPAFRGKYCSLTSAVPLNLGPNGTKIPATQSAGPFPGLALQIGLCLPSTCTNEDAKALVKAGISMLPASIAPILNALPVNVTCAKENTDISQDTRAIVSVCLSACVVAVLLLGTAYDLLVVQSCDLDSTTGKTADEPGNPKIQKLVDDESLPLINKTPKVDAKRPDSPGTLGKVLLAFSLYTNATKLLSTKQGEGSLRCLNGVRFLSMSWVILGHTFAFTLGCSESLVTYSLAFLGRFTAQAVVNATYSVDSFFLLSGLLVTYLTMREMSKKEGKINWFLYYFHRYWRLTPPLALIMMVYIPLFKYWGSGPFWPQDGTEVNYCAGTWWTNLLYVNNVVKADQQCAGWTWYLANDMQFYVISPVILVPLYYSGVLGSVVIGVFLLATLITSGVISSVNQYGTGALYLGVQAYFQSMYIRPWTRMGPYLIGMTLGYVFYRTNCKVSLPKILVVGGWLAATACGISVIYGLQGVNDSSVQLANDISALYNATSRTAWALALAWLIFACCTGHGGPVNRLLSWDVFVPLSRLTYCAYLVHPIIMFWFYYGHKTSIILSDPILVYYFLANMLMSYAVAFVVSLAFEAPMMGLEKVLLGRDKRA